jgi:hypothetical protein
MLLTFIILLLSFIILFIIIVYYNYFEYTAVIIEPRITDLFELVLDNFYSKLDNRWNFIIFTTNNNNNFIIQLINNKFYKEKSRTTIINLNIDNLNYDNYSKILIDKRLYDYISTEIFLIFQLDSLLSDTRYNDIYNYMNYDYIGALCPYKNSPNTVGCGGLSIRKKSKMLKIINDINYYNQNNHQPEDVFFFDHPNIKKASIIEANEFCSGMVFSENPVGIHQTFNFITEDQKDILEKHFPKIRELEYKYLNLPIWNEPNNINLIFNNVKKYNF